jgi:predicted membrane-bound spermidine synthase
VSPLLIARLGEAGVGSGQAAGRLFFTNTLGGLAGGWLTALVLIPHVPLRFVLAGTGVLLGLMGAAWMWARSANKVLVWFVPLTAVAAAQMAQTPRPYLTQTDPGAPRVRVVERVQSHSGLLLVLEVAGRWRNLLLNGVDQGAMDPVSGASYHPFSDYLAFMSHRFHPRGKRALVLGLGCGVLAKALHARGLDVTAVEIEPAIADVARRHFGLPGGVRVVLEDARAFLATDHNRYDLVILDAYAGESSPWYVLTEEGLQAAKARLAPGGRVLLNSVTRADGSSEGLRRLESTLLRVFGEALVYLEPRLPTESQDLVNATLIAGTKLVATDEPYPATPSEHVAPFLGDMEAIPPRPARRGARIDHDDHSSLELAEASVRMRWREKVVAVLSPRVLED